MTTHRGQQSQKNTVPSRLDFVSSEMRVKKRESLNSWDLRRSRENLCGGDDVVSIYRLSLGSLRTDVFMRHTRYAMPPERQEQTLLPSINGNISPQNRTE